MRFALHGMCSLHSNILSDVRLAKETGYQGLEIHTEKLWRYIQAGFSAEQLKQRMDEFGIVPTAIDIIGAVEVTDKASQRQLFQDSETLCRFAQAVGAPTIQLNAFEALNGLTKEQNIELTAQNIRQIVDIGKSYGIRFQYEGAAWTPIANWKITSACTTPSAATTLVLFWIHGTYGHAAGQRWNKWQISMPS